MKTTVSNPEIQSSTSTQSKFEFWAAPFTPFSSDGIEVCYKTIERQAQHLIENGVEGAFICGTTGEGFSLSTDERKKIAETWVKGFGSQIKVIVHVGHNCLEKSQELCKHAEEIGAYAVASIGPCFFPPTSPEALVEMLQQIAQSCELPFFYYHMPSMARVPYKASELLPSLMERIPNFAGIKFTHEDIEDFSTCVDIAGDDCRMFFGRDEILLEGIRNGAHGAVGSTYNYHIHLYRAVLDAFLMGDLEEAEANQKKAQDFINLFLKYGGLNAGKALMKMCGVDCGGPRLPLTELDPSEYQQMQKEFSEAGFFQ
ncbi:dihydrodipicolinate synthase family protein [Coraliomargarita parva]|uniref:dihydrodipicolinate synthase family protein n=1 Tax=Coraliomargarita parva TaxID=3014050 RepID=UPI0022B55322|nr:dihydrodipicolinate synthase family protein [Coraliomargarita parva]